MVFLGVVDKCIREGCCLVWVGYFGGLFGGWIDWDCGMYLFGLVGFGWWVVYVFVGDDVYDYWCIEVLCVV